jgi:hypothetical protein
VVNPVADRSAEVSASFGASRPMGRAMRIVESAVAIRPGRYSLVVTAALGMGLVLGAAVPFVDRALLLVGLASCLIVIIVAFYPQFAAYLLIGITPLVAGMDRGSVIPVIRPNEAVLALVAAGLVLRAILTARTGSLPWPRMDAQSASILFVAVAASVIPLAWMLLRNQQIETDDVLYALLPCKYYGVYLVVRASAKTERQVRTCLWISMGTAAIVGVLAILQSLLVPVVTRFLVTYYTSFGYTAGVTNQRGGSTLSLSIAVADLMIFNLAIAVGFLYRRIGPRAPTLAFGMLFVAGVFAAAQFSGAIGLVIGVVIIAVVLRRFRPLAAFLPAFALAAYGLRPVIESRLTGFQSASGVPVSWIGRWQNLTNYFWPVLFDRGNFILGVRPAARVVAPHRAAGYVWIESGYTWLLWGGGIPLVLAFLYFLWVNVRHGLRVARTRLDAVGVAGLASVVALGVVACLMTLDPHLTYRGSADLLFVLLALTAVNAVDAGPNAAANGKA